MKMKRLSLGICIFFLVFSSGSYGFKAGSHVWVAQKVIDDLQDGKVSIKVNGVTKSFAVEPSIVQAILANQNVYRMGHIGPDAGPDIYAGQMVMHPGTQSFGTDEWAIGLKAYIDKLENHYTDKDWYHWQDQHCEQQTYNLDELWEYIGQFYDTSSDSFIGEIFTAMDDAGLLDSIASGVNDAAYSDPKLKHASVVNPMHVAYEKGVLGHISGDVFAHSYVNQYAGDVFWLTNGEIETEKRHSAIEGFLDKNLAPLSQGHTYNLITSPSAFIADAFIFNEDLVKNFRTIPGMAGADYLYAISKLRRGVRKAAASCVWTAIDRFAMQIAGVVSPVDFLFSEHQIKAVNAVQDKIHGLTSDVKQSLGDAHTELNKVVTDVHRENFNAIESSMKAIDSGVNRLNKLEQNIINAEKKLENEIVGKVCDYEKKIVERFCPPFVPCKEIIKWKKGPACSKHSAYLAAVRVRDAAIRERNKQWGSIRDGITEELAQLEQTLKDIHQFSNAAFDTIVRLADISADISPFRLGLKEWDGNIKKAMIAWVDANQQVIRNAMIESKQTPTAQDRACWKMTDAVSLGHCAADNPLDPIIQWSSRYAPLLIGVPNELLELSSSADQVWGSISGLKDTRLRNKLINISSPVSRAFVLDLENNVSEELYGIDLIDKVLDFTNQDEWSEIYNGLKVVFATKMDDRDINQLFSSDPMNLGLFTYPQVAGKQFTDVMKKDMGIAGSSKYVNPETFAPIKNAIVLSKLALLDTKQLNKVAAALGITSAVSKSVYGSPLYSLPTPKYGSHNASTYNPYNPGPPPIIGINPNHVSDRNILYHAIRNIDGHQQWKEKANPIPKRHSNPAVPPYSTKAGNPEFPPLVYGYKRQNKEDGFRFWELEKNKGKYFYGLFDRLTFSGIQEPVDAPPSCGPNEGKTYSRSLGAALLASRRSAIEQFCGACGYTATQIGPGSSYGAPPNLFVRCKSL